MSPQLFQARVSQHSLIKGTYHWLSFELIEPHALQFQAGQFLMLNLPGVPVKRAYSIASNPVDTNNLDLLIDISPQGEGTLYLQSLNPGEPVSFLAPLGNFTLAPDPEETRLIMVATGSGISAVRSMILYQLQLLMIPTIILHWGSALLKTFSGKKTFVF
jgi:phenol hydroxylase P5 protein